MSAVQDYAVAVTSRQHAELLAVERPATPLAPLGVAGPTVATLISAGTELACAYEADQYPLYPGYAAVFRVEVVGSEVRHLRPGDLAFCMGGHRSYQRVEQPNVVRVPDGLSPYEAVFARLMGVSMSTLTTTTARPPQQVVVSGLGPVGHLAAQIFHSCGYRVIACDPLPERRALIEQMGLKPVLPAVPLDDPDIDGRVALVLECSGHEQATLDACRAVAKRGEVVLVGVPWRRRTELTAHELLHTIFHRYAVVRSGWEWELPLDPTDFRTNSIFTNLAGALQWITEGRVRVGGLYSKVSPREAQSAYQSLLHNTAEHLAVVFDWTMIED